MAVIQRKFDRLLALTRDRFDALEHVLAKQPLGLRVERFHWFEDGERIPEEERPDDYLLARVAIMTGRKLLGPFNDTHFCHRDLEAFFATLLSIGGEVAARLTRTSGNRFLVEALATQFQPGLQGVRAEFDFEPDTSGDEDRRTPLLDEAFLARSIAEAHRYANADGRAGTSERWTLLDPDEYAVELCEGLWAHTSTDLRTAGTRIVFDRNRFRLTNAASVLDKTFGDGWGQLRLPFSTASTSWENRLLAHKAGDASLSRALGTYIARSENDRPPDAVERRVFAWQRFALPL